MSTPTRETINGALRGDRAAQDECTQAGYALPCHACGGSCKHVEDKAFGDIIICEARNCPGGQHVFYPSLQDALRAHNTRAPLPEEPKEALTGWIDCRERVPDAGIRVLIWRTRKTPGRRIYFGALGYYDTWLDQYGNMVEVTHWMPLPEPPDPY